MSDPIILGKLPKPPKRGQLLDVDKTPNPTRKPKKGNKKVSVQKHALIGTDGPIEQIFLGEYFNIHTMQKHPITKKFIERQAVELKQWADLETSLNIYDFTDMKGYNPKTFYQWCLEYPEMEAANEYALRRIGSRREFGAMTRKFAESTIHRTLGHYHDVWKKETIMLAKLKEELSAQNETKVVVIERFPDDAYKLTPEEVAGSIHKATSDGRQYGPQAIWNKGDE